MYESIQDKLQDKCKDFPEVECIPPTRGRLLQSLAKYKINLMREDLPRIIKGVVNSGKK